MEKIGIKFVPKVVKDGEFQDTYDHDRRANREKKQDKLDTEMIGLVKKKKKRSNQAIKRKSSGPLMKNVGRLSEQKVVPEDVQSAKLNVKLFKNETVGPSGFTVFV